MTRDQASAEPHIAARYSAREVAFERWRRAIGLPAGPIAFGLVLLLAAPGLTPTQSALSAVMAWVLVWWLTEPVPLPVTAMLGPALCVVLGVGSAKVMFASFGDPIVLLFLGSFLLAAAMTKHGLDRRVAYLLLSLPGIDGHASRIVAVFAVLAAGLSMWLSNTATTMILYPVAIGVMTSLAADLERAGGAHVSVTRLRFSTALMLTASFASSIGGIGTPVGTPPNLISVAQLGALAGVRVTFAGWMIVAVPILVTMLAVHLLVMRVLLPPELPRFAGSAALIATGRRSLGAMSRAERTVLVVFLLTVAGWILPSFVDLAASGGTRGDIPARLPESVVALLAAVLLFVLPDGHGRGQGALEWRDAAGIDWGTLMLFGGGLALGGAMFDSGLSGILGHFLVSSTGADSTGSLTLLFVVAAVVLTEVTSNVAAATMLVPLAIASAQSAGVGVLEPALGAAFGSSMGFALPVSTAPNAIVYGSGCVPVLQMIRCGLVLDLVSMVVISIGVLVLVPIAF